MSDGEGTGGSEVDSGGRASPYRPGDRIVTLQVPRRGMGGTIVRQRLHHDGGGTFWGNCFTRMDDGSLVEWNSWQLDREEGWEGRASAKEAARLAGIEAGERVELARLKAKYEAGDTVSP